MNVGSGAFSQFCGKKVEFENLLTRTAHDLLRDDLQMGLVLDYNAAVHIT